MNKMDNIKTSYFKLTIIIHTISFVNGCKIKWIGTIRPTDTLNIYPLTERFIYQSDVQSLNNIHCSFDTIGFINILIIDFV